MSDVQNKIVTFEKLDYKQKYDTVLSMLEVLKEWDDMFSDFYDLLLSLKEETSENLLITIYSLIVSTINEVEKENKEKEYKKLEKMKEKLKKLQEMEEKEKTDEDLDKMIEAI